MAEGVDSQIQQLLKGFEHLMPYFIGINETDLLDYTPEDLLSAAKPEHKLSMKKFVKTIMSKVWDKGNAEAFQARESAGAAFPCLISSATGSNWRIGLHNKIQSKQPLFFHRTTIPIDRVCDVLQREFLSFPSFRQSAVRVCVDIAGNNLSDVDLDCVQQIVECVQHATDRAELILCMAGNRFRKTESHVLNLLRNPRISYVDVCMSPLATIECKYFYSTLQRENRALFERFIFIPQAWVSQSDTDGWPSLVDNARDVCEMIKTAHNGYYTAMGFVPRQA